jgi:hypothetical protein
MSDSPPVPRARPGDGRHDQLGNFQTALLGRITPASTAYIDELKARVGSVTVYGSVYKLRRASELIAPGRDFAWLAEIEKDLALIMRPRCKFDRTVLAEVLVEAGLTLIHEAETSPSLSALTRARHVRNGLMIALLAMCPIRLKNFATLEIGRSFVETRSKWWIVIRRAILIP